MKRKRTILCLLVLSLLLAGCAVREEKTSTSVTLTEHDFVKTALPTPDVEPLTGDWYGWWHMTETSGDWARMDGYWWDCCAHAEGEDVLTLALWDENFPKEQGLGNVVILQNGETLRTVAGDFLDRSLTADEQELLVTSDEAGRMLTIRGRYPAVNSEGGFRYEIRLRPWGSRWTDGEDKPYYYEDWYLLLIEAGKSMPDELGGGR